MKHLKLYENFDDDMSGIFKAARGAIQKGDLVKVKDNLGKPKFPSNGKRLNEVIFYGLKTTKLK